MRYLKSTAFLLLIMSSSTSILSRSAIAQLAEGTDNPSDTEETEGAAGSPEASLEASEAPNQTVDLRSLLDGAQGSTASRLQTRSKVATPAVSEAQSPQFAASLDTPEASEANAIAPARNSFDLAAFQRLLANQNKQQTEVAVEDLTEAQSSPKIALPSQQVAQADAELPVLEETPPTAAPGSPAPDDPGPNEPALGDPPPTAPPAAATPEIDSVPTDRPVGNPNAELGDLPDILFADPNPLSLPATPEDINIERNPVVTLEQAIELAYRNSQALQAAALQLEQTDAAVREARAANLPTVQAGANLNSTQRNSQPAQVNPLTGQEITSGVSSGIDTTLGGQVSINYDLLTGGSREANIRATELQRQVAALTLESQQEQIRLTTANNYYALQESGETIRIQSSFLQEAERNLRDSRLRQEVGVGTRFDTLRAEVQYANARQQLIQAQGNQRIARRDIARLLNLPPSAGIEATPVAVADNWPLTLEDSILLAYQNRAELEQQLLQADISEQQRQIALSATRPQVGLSATYSAQDQLNSGSGEQGGDFIDNISFGAQFQMLLFDGGATRARARQRELDSQISEEQFSEQSDQIRFDVEQAYFNLETNQENITTSRIAVSQAEEALALANLRLQAGVGTQLDVLTAQSELTQAQANNVTAILNYNRALAAMQRAVSNVTTE